MNFFKNLKIKWKIIFIFGFILSIYIIFIFLNFNQVKRASNLLDEIIPFKDENIVLNRIIVESSDLSLNVDKFLSVKYEDLFEKTNDVISVMLTDVTSLSDYQSLESDLLKVRNDLIYLNDSKNGEKISEINLRKFNVYSNIKIFNNKINELLLANTDRIEVLVSEQKQGISTIIKATLFLGVFMFIFILINGYILIISISKPIIFLKRSVEDIIKGNFDTKIDVSNNDEIGELGSSFNQMTKNLKESYSSLEDKIKKRTEELDLKINEISENNIELEKNKLVIVNLLEDFEKEKANAENLVVIRTKELSDEKARLLSSINSLKIGFAIVDIGGKFIINNPSLLSIVDIKEDFVSLDHISEHLKVEGIGLLDRLQKCTKDKCVVEIEELMFGAKYLRLFLNPVFALDNNPIGGVLLLEDITEQKVLDRSRDEFFAVASHELRTPLTAIRGNSEMILDSYKDKIKDKDVLEMLTDIDEASVRLISIVNDFLEVSRLEQGNITFEKTNFNILELVQKVMTSLEAEVAKKGIELEIIKPEDKLPEVFSDKGKIDQILFNLVGNALKFTERGSIKTSFEVVDNFLKVRVADTGKGISVKNESLLFRKFQPAGNDVLARDVTKSTGLGLYISKILIDKLGGTIGLEKTEEGKGSVFFFTIPLAS